MTNAHILVSAEPAPIGLASFDFAPVGAGLRSAAEKFIHRALSRMPFRDTGAERRDDSDSDWTDDLMAHLEERFI